MKKLLIILGCFVSLSGYSQTFGPVLPVGGPRTETWVPGVLRVDSAMAWPQKDTTFTPVRIFTVVVQPSSRTPYMWDGIRWNAFALATGSYVNSFNGRTGTVVPASGDYTAAQVTNAVSAIGAYANPTWITSLDYSKLTNVPASNTLVSGYGVNVVVGANTTFKFDTIAVPVVDTIYGLTDSTFAYVINHRAPNVVKIRGNGGSGTGGVSNFLFTNGNGLIGSVTTPTSTPNLTLGTALNGLVNANGVGFGVTTIGYGLSYNTSTGTLMSTITDNSQLSNGAKYLTSASGLVVGGTNVNVTGAGSVTNPFVINANATAGTGSSDSLKHLFVDTSASPRNGYVLAFDSTNHKWYLRPPNAGSGGSGTVTLFSFNNGGGFTGTVTNGATTPALSLVLQNAAADGSTKGQATYTANDFLSTSGVISLNYAAAQKATSSQPGFLTAADWTTFNNKFSGNLTSAHIFVGNISNVGTDVAVTGDIAINNAGVTTIQPAVVTYAKIQNVTASRLLGRYTGSNGVTQEIQVGTGLVLPTGTGILAVDSSGGLHTQGYYDSRYANIALTGVYKPTDTVSTLATQYYVKSLATKDTTITVTVATGSTYTNAALASTNIIGLFLNGVRVPLTVVSGQLYATFNSSTGAFTLTNGTFTSGDNVVIQYLIGNGVAGGGGGIANYDSAIVDLYQIDSVTVAFIKKNRAIPADTLKLNALAGPNFTVTTTGSSGPATLTGNVLNIPQYTGGGGSTLLTRQSITSGTSATGTSGGLLVKFNFTSTASTFTFTMPASPTDQQVVEFEGGGTLTSGTEVTSLTVSPNSGQTIIGSVALTTFTVGEYAKYRYDSTLAIWYREN